MQFDTPDVCTLNFNEQQQDKNSWLRWFICLLPLDEAVAYRAVFVTVSGSDGRMGGNALELAK